jgi:hypothetical protein
MGKKIIAKQQTHKYEVVDYSFKVVGESQINVFEFQGEIFSQDCNL